MSAQTGTVTGMFLRRAALAASVFVHNAVALTAYTVVNNIAVVDLENVAHNNLWQVESSLSGYKGNSYYRYIGPERHPPVAGDVYDNFEGMEQNDLDGSYQGSEQDWLKIPVLVTVAGAYSVNVFGYHTWDTQYANGTDGPATHGRYLPFDSDATVWTHAVGYKLPVRMSHGETNHHPNQFYYLGFGAGDYNPDPPTQCFPGNTIIIKPSEVPTVVTFYIAGRDRNYCPDHVHIYRTIGNCGQVQAASYPAGYKDVTLPFAPSVETDAPRYEDLQATGATAPRSGGRAARPATTGLDGMTLFSISGRRIDSAVKDRAVIAADGARTCRMVVMR